MISLIVAAAENNAIGKDNELPWHLPDDLKFFKKTTLGKPMIMGRKTWDSIGGRALPGRTSIVLSRSKTIMLPPGVLHFSNLQDALEATQDENEVMIIGGGQLFGETLEMADQIYYTVVHTEIENATAFFPTINKEKWELTWEQDHEADAKHAHAFTFQKWERRKS